MVKFACKIFYLDEIIRCSFNLNKSEAKLFIYMIKQNKELSIKQISKDSNFERSTIQKSIKLLLEKNLVKRYQVNNSKGGFSFMYKSIPKKDFTSQMKIIIDKWYSEAKKEIKRI